MNVLNYNRHDLEFAMRGFEMLHAASVLIEKKKWTTAYASTELFLIGFGAEIAMKGQQLHAGKPKKELRAFGHDIAKLWKSDANQEFQECARASVSRLPSADICYLEELEKQILRLNELHGDQSDFALRYFTPVDGKAPKPYLMTIAFGSAAQNLIFRSLKQWKHEMPNAPEIEAFQAKLAESHYFDSFANWFARISCGE